MAQTHGGCGLGSTHTHPTHSHTHTHHVGVGGSVGMGVGWTQLIHGFTHAIPSLSSKHLTLEKG